MDNQTNYLASIASSADVKALEESVLQDLAAEIRQKLIETVSKNGGHLASNLGVVETTIALHRVFDFPQDQIVFDVGHQCYAHKLLTGRADDFDTLRQLDGLSGFPAPKESACDAFIVGHSSTAVSAANGLAKAKSLQGDDGYVIAFVGDGAMTGGLLFEGLSNAGRSHDRLIVLLNDNRMSINHNVGFTARHLSRLRAKPRYVRFKKNFGKGLRKFPLLGKPLFRLLQSMKLGLKSRLYHNSSMFEDMGYYYLGPVDGHNIREITQALEAAKTIDSPVVIHVDTIKGNGYRFALENPDAFHGVSSFDIETGQLLVSGPTFSSVFGETMKDLAKADDRLCFITAAMQDGTGLSEIAAEFPKRCFDVGIAEEHAVTFASGLSQNGMLPVFAVYSTFLQRSFDQLINDTSIINSHVVLAIDRAGIVPGDGETHQGIFDVPMLNAIPRATVYAPCCFAEFRTQLKQAVYDVDGIAAVRYPKGGEWRIPEGFVPDYQPFTWYRSRRSDVLIVTYGRLFGNVLAAANELAQKGRYVSVLKLNRIKPIDPACIRVALTYFRVLFFEEGSRRGGVAEYFGSQLAENNFARRYEVYAIDRFIPCCSTEEGLHIVGLDVEGIVAAVEETVEMTSSDMDFEQLPADGEEPVFDSETDEEFEEASDGDTSLDKEHSDDAVDLAEPSVTVIADEITVSPVEEDITDE
ncbi:MAG: 1-deoxy-D-xylulose-5-phosphate synthase [Clostridia bacterium]|nr:1-deoxy-D-xylulose-5-phosphate synthase [Clostridia bacterium]